MIGGCDGTQSASHPLFCICNSLILEKVWFYGDFIIEKVWFYGDFILEKVWFYDDFIIEKVYLCNLNN